MDDQDFLSQRLEERKGLFKGIFPKRHRKLQALEDACEDLRRKNSQLEEALKKKDVVVDHLREFLVEQVSAISDKAPDQEKPSA